MYFAIPNLKASVVSPVPEPWTLKTETPPPYADGKTAVVDFCNRVDTKHAMLSMVEGTTAEVRVTMEDNPPFRLHGIMADYDNPLPDNPVEYIKGHAPVEFMPNYLVRTASGNGRLVWEFETPILFSNRLHMKEFMKLLSRNLKLNKWLGGLETEALTNWVKYYELGQEWTAIDALAAIPRSHLELWFFQSATEIKFDTDKRINYKIPIEALAKEVEERFPGRWSGPFEIGARGVRFWDPTADNVTAAKVMPDGMLCYTGNKPFVSWKQLFGAAFVEQYEAASIGDIVENCAYDGREFWIQESEGVWMAWGKEDFAQELRTTHGRDSRRKPGQTASEVDVIENYIKRHRRVKAAFPFLFFPTGIIRHNDANYLNIARTKALPPAPPCTPERMTFADGRTHFPLIYRLLRNMFATGVEGEEEEGATQLTHLLAWLKYAYTNALERTPKPGQVIVLAGPAGKGKTFLSWRVISGLLGGHADGSGHLVQGERWTQRVIEQPVMTIDDGTALASYESLKAFTARLKRYAANPAMIFEEKYKAAGEVPWFGRIVVTCNLDAESLRILPDMDSTTMDKICLFKASDPILDFGDWQTNNATIRRELPFFARFMLDWPYPEETVAEEKRFGVRPYHHPDLLEEARQHGLGQLNDLLRGMLDSYFSTRPDQDYWIGTAAQLYADLSVTNPSATRDMKYASLAPQLGKMAKAGYNVRKVLDMETHQTTWHIARTLFGKGKK